MVVNIFFLKSLLFKIGDYDLEVSPSQLLRKKWEQVSVVNLRANLFLLCLFIGWLFIISGSECDF